MIAQDQHDDLIRTFQEYKGETMFTDEQRKRLTEGLAAMRDAQQQKQEIAGKDDVVAVQLIKGMGFTNIVFDAYGPSETTFTLDDSSFHTFVERLALVDAVEMGHDCFTFKRHDDHCPAVATAEDDPSMLEPEDEIERDDLQ